MTRITVLRYVLVASIILILIALASWYFFLRTQKETIAKGDAGRGGAFTGRPFENKIGSTYENIVSSFGAAVGNEGGTGKPPRLLPVGKTPTAGAGFVRNGPPSPQPSPKATAGTAKATDGRSTSTRLRFVERGAGYVLEAEPATGALTRLTNTLVPGVYEAHVLRSGNVIMRGEDEQGRVTTSAGSIVASSSASGVVYVLSQRRLPDGIRSIQPSPTGEEILYIIDDGNTAIGIRASWDGKKTTQSFSLAVPGWRLQWLLNDRIVIAQNPSDTVAGYAYAVGSNGALSPILQNIPGLTLLPHPSSPALLYGESGAGLSLFARISDTATAVSLPVRTTADKCVWAPASPKATQGKSLVAYCAVPQAFPGNNFLDFSSRGELHTSDAWWRIDVSAASAELLYSPGNLALDVERPIIDDTGNYIAFINGRDKSLWLLRVSEQ